MLKETSSLRDIQFAGQGGAISRKMVIAVLLGVALIAFEIFNFDTTQSALTNLLVTFSISFSLFLVCCGQGPVAE